MRTPDEIAEIATNSTSVEDCIKRLGIADDHVKASHELPAYARVMIAFVREAIKGDARGRPLSTDTVLDRARSAMSGLFPISQEEARTAATERIIRTVEGWRSPLITDDDGTEITVRMAWGNSELMDRVIVAIEVRAVELQRESDNELRLLAALRELSRRQRAGEA